MIDYTQGHRNLKMPTKMSSTLGRGWRVVLDPVKAWFIEDPWLGKAANIKGNPKAAGPMLKQSKNRVT